MPVVLVAKSLAATAWAEVPASSISHWSNAAPSGPPLQYALNAGALEPWAAALTLKSVADGQYIMKAIFRVDQQETKPTVITTRRGTTTVPVRNRPGVVHGGIGLDNELGGTEARQCLCGGNKNEAGEESGAGEQHFGKDAKKNEQMCLLTEREERLG